MLRLSKIACVFTLCLLVFGTVSLRAQQAPQQQKNTVSPELWQLLTDWSQASSNVKKLHGKHQRHVYDTTFGVEKVSDGEFWHETPDKGRIDVKPIKITQAMVAARNKKDAQVRRDGKNQPYKLESDAQERWICDGINVFDIDDVEKTARVLKLPPQVRGQNIMNSPLPFLFGMRPDKAVERFNMTIVQDWRPKYALVRLKAEPRMREDAQNWSSAEIFLDTKTFLPTAVKLVDPPKTKETVYKFSDMEVNKTGIFEGFIGKKPWDPGFSRDYKVHVLQAGQDQASASGNAAPQQPRQTPTAQGPPQKAVATASSVRAGFIPKVIGMPHDHATALLLKAGVAKEAIVKLNAGAAPATAYVYRVRTQKPSPDAKIVPGEKVVLQIFDKVATTAAAPGQAQPQ